MDMRIDEMTSTVRTTDSSALVDPAVLERIVRAVLSRVREERHRDSRIAGERRINSSTVPDESISRGSR